VIQNSVLHLYVNFQVYIFGKVVYTVTIVVFASIEVLVRRQGVQHSAGSLSRVLQSHSINFCVI
jgi:hypothetical protein